MDKFDRNVTVWIDLVEGERSRYLALRPNGTPDPEELRIPDGDDLLSGRKRSLKSVAAEIVETAKPVLTVKTADADVRFVLDAWEALSGDDPLNVNLKRWAGRIRRYLGEHPKLGQREDETSEEWRERLVKELPDAGWRYLNETPR